MYSCTTCLLFVCELHSEKYLRRVHPVVCSLISKAGCIVFGGVWGGAGVDVELGLCALAPVGEEAGNQHISSPECFSHT